VHSARKFSAVMSCLALQLGRYAAGGASHRI